VRCVDENRKKRKRLRWQAANHGCHCFDGRPSIPIGWRLRLLSENCTGYQPFNNNNSHKPSDRLPLLSARPAVTFPAKSVTAIFDQYQIILLGDRGTCVCEQLAQSRYMKAERPGVELMTA